jgi:integrase
MSGIHKLKAKQIDAAAPRDKVYRLSDGAGLFLSVMPTGARYWQLRYRFGGAERLFQIGAYSRHGDTGLAPVTLLQARAEAAKWREVIRLGKDPVSERRLAGVEEVVRRNWTFEKAFEAWVEHNLPDWSAHHVKRNRGLVRRILLPKLGELPVDRISTAAVLDAVKTAANAGIADSARRAQAIATQIFAFAILSGQATTNPARDLGKAIRKPEVTHFAALTRDELPDLMVGLSGDRLEPEVNAALRMMLYTALRDHELRGAQWREIDLDAGVWTVPAERMKRRVEHAVPLPSQALGVLGAMKALNDDGPDAWVFASRISKSGYLAENTLRLALHRLGFKVTAHGLRSLLTDTLNELGFRHDWIEAQLHHAIANKVTAAYKRTDFLEQRRVMMQFWADYCDGRHDGKSHDEAAGVQGNVITLRPLAIEAA